MFEFDKLPKPIEIGSYPKEDVTFLVKDLSHAIREEDNLTREKKIQSGIHYSEMIPVEYQPTDEYIELFHSSLENSAKKIAEAVAIVSEEIYEKKKDNLVLVSLLRAGTPIGVLIKKYFEFRYNISLPHYSISIIRGKGFDENALKYIYKNHDQPNIQFIDGWTGKGAITKVLQDASDDFNRKYRTNLSPDLAVLADPAFCVDIYGTREDFLIPSACLNSTVSGLLSRSIHRKDLIGDNDFHGVKFYREFEKNDLSNYYIDEIVKFFPQTTSERKAGKTPNWLGMKEVRELQAKFDVSDINFVKPGVGETTRVLLRRIPWKILIRDMGSPNVKHILMLAKDRNVPVEEYPLKAYHSCGIIKEL